MSHPDRPRTVRTAPPGPLAIAASVVLTVSAVLSFILGIRLLDNAGNHKVIRDDFIFSAKSVLITFGTLALATGAAKVGAAVGIWARRPWAAVLGIVLVSVAAFFALPALGGRRPLVGIP